MASGKPVVGTATGGTPEMIQEGHTGVLVPPRDPEAMAGAILRLLKDKGASEKMGEEARQRAETEFSLASHVQKIQELYRSLLS